MLRQALDQRGKLPETASITLAALAHVCYERNQLERAHRLLSRAAKVDPNPASTNMPVTIAVQRALIQSAQGDHVAAQATIQSALELNAKRLPIWATPKGEILLSIYPPKDSDFVLWEAFGGTVKVGNTFEFQYGAAKDDINPAFVRKSQNEEQQGESPTPKIAPDSNG